MNNAYTDLQVWQRAVDLSVALYALTKQFPTEEKYGLTSQMRRAAVSIPSNIAEGRSRGSRKDFINFLKIALGSATELETQLIIAKRIGYIQLGDSTAIDSLLSETCRMLHGIIKKLEASSQQ